MAGERMWEWLVWILVIAALVAAIVVPIYFWNKKKHGSRGCGSGSRSCKPCVPTWAQSTQTGDVTVTASATGPTGITAESLGPIDIMSTTITTCPGSDALVCTVSAQTSIATVDVEGGVEEAPVLETSTDIAQVIVQLLVDGTPVAPSVVFNGIVRVFTQKMGIGQFKAELDTLLQGNSFTWVATGVAPGPHTVTAQATLIAVAETEESLFTQAAAEIANGILVVQPANF